MTLRHAVSLPATVAGVWFLATICPTRGQVVHGESIDTSAPAGSARPATKSAAVGDGAVLQAEFETLAAFQFNAPDAAVTNQAALDQVAKQIPENIKKLDGKVVRIRGFMMPVKESAGKATEFLITRSQPSCCFSGATGMNEFITVKSAGQGVVENMDDAVSIEGTLHVGVFTDGGYVVGLYEMDGGKKVESRH